MVNDACTYRKQVNTSTAELIMNVNAGSKLSNLIPFAVNSFGQPSCRKVIWKSSSGAVAKTVACVERFKQIVLPLSNQTSPYPTVHNKESISQLYQLTKINTEQRHCVDRDARVTYIREGPSIIISLSKDPIPGESFAQLITPESSSTSLHMLPSSTTCDVPKPLSRRQLAHPKKRKRDTTKDPPSNRFSPSSSHPNANLSDNPLDDPLAIPPVTHQCPRFAPALLAVSNAVKKSKKKKRS